MPAESGGCQTQELSWMENFKFKILIYLHIVMGNLCQKAKVSWIEHKGSMGRERNGFGIESGYMKAI